MLFRSVVELLLLGGADINAKDEEGITPLHRAASGSSIEVVEQLLKQKANKILKDRRGNMPAHLAAFSGSTDIAELLLEGTNAGDSPLHFAAAGGCASEKRGKSRLEEQERADTIRPVMASLPAKQGDARGDRSPSQQGARDAIQELARPPVT